MREIVHWLSLAVGVIYAVDLIAAAIFTAASSGFIASRLLFISISAGVFWYSRRDKPTPPTL